VTTSTGSALAICSGLIIAERIIREEQVQATVLGCTELPLIFGGVEMSVPYIDVMQVHINTLVDLILRD
jgi:aspartate racemase